MAVQRAERQPERLPGLDLPVRHRLDRPPEDVHGVGRRVQHEGDDGAPVRLAQVGPGPAVAHRIDLGNAVVHDEDLHQQRRSPEDLREHLDGPAQPPGLLDAHDGQRHRQQRREHHRDREEFQREQRALPEHRKALDNEFDIHGQAVLSPRAPRRSS
ncbi:hypothetical protein D9M69_560770 [compost metagenome]